MHGKKLAQLIMWWYKRVLYNCKKATFLLEKKHSEGITFMQEIELRVHLKGCYVCRRYNEQSKLIDQMVRQLHEAPENDAITLDENFKSELRKRIDTELKKN